MSEHALDELEHELSGLLSRLNPAERKKLSREIVRDLRKSQVSRIRQQKNPDGSAYTRRKAQFITVQREMRFIWNNERRHLKNWRNSGRLITGFDMDRGAVRSFRRGDIERFLVIRKERVKTGGKNRQTRMFKNLATNRYMRISAGADSAAVFFAPAAANIAAVHQFGLKERLRNLDVQYPARQLLGFSPDDTRRIESAIISFLSS